MEVSLGRKNETDFAERRGLETRRIRWVWEKNMGRGYWNLGAFGRQNGNLVQWELPGIYPGDPSNEGYGAFTSHFL